MSAGGLFGLDVSQINRKALKTEDFITMPIEAMNIFNLFRKVRDGGSAEIPADIQKKMDASVDYWQKLVNRLGLKLNVHVVIKRLLEMMTSLQPHFPQWKDTDAAGNKVERYFFPGEAPSRLVGSLIENFGDVAEEIANNPSQMWGTIAHFVPEGDEDGDDQDRVAYSQHMWIRDLFRRVVKKVNPDAWEAAKKEARAAQEIER